MAQKIVDFTNNTPAAPEGRINVQWQKSVSGNNITYSASIPEPQAGGGGGGGDSFYISVNGTKINPV